MQLAMATEGELLRPARIPMCGGWVLCEAHDHMRYLLEGTRLLLYKVPPSLRHRFQEGAQLWCICAHPTIGGVRFGISHHGSMEEIHLSELDGAVLQTQYVPPLSVFVG